jgi:hypothetical protein
MAKNIRITPFRYRTRKGKTTTEYLIERKDFFLFGWEFLFHHGLVKFPTRTEALEYVRLYNAVRKGWRKKK